MDNPHRNKYGRNSEASGRMPPSRFARPRNRITLGLFNGLMKRSDTSRSGKSTNNPAIGSLPESHTNTTRRKSGIRTADAKTCFTRTFNYRKSRSSGLKSKALSL